MKMPPIPPVPDTVAGYKASHVGDLLEAYGEQVRKACAQACEAFSDQVDLNPPDDLFQRGKMQGAWDCAAAIRSNEA